MNDKAKVPELSPLAEFAASNPAASVRLSTDKTAFVIDKPWGDDTVSVRVPVEDAETTALLNGVVLPERYSAIWHREDQRFEIIYTAFPLHEEDLDILERRFTFTHSGLTHSCYFGDSSPATISLGKYFTPSGPPTASDYRNLFSFSQIGTMADVEAPESFKHFLESARPLSFWIENVPWNDDDVLDLVNHLNFYMSYYDTTSPRINVHSPAAENVRTQPQTRFPFDKFPTAINSRSIDVNLLHFWHASRTGDPAKRFLYNYQILEYAAFYQLEENVSQSIRKLLAAPDAIASSDAIALQILETLAESKLTDPQKLQWLFRRVVNCNLIWREIKLNIEAFVEPMRFDGGYVVQPIVKPKWELEDFQMNWSIVVPDTLRGIRNALSHGREARMAAVITPTTANFAKIQSWVPLVDVAAREVMVYRNVV